jgi:hypothetical protein
MAPLLLHPLLDGDANGAEAHKIGSRRRSGEYRDAGGGGRDTSTAIPERLVKRRYETKNKGTEHSVERRQMARPPSHRPRSLISWPSLGVRMWLTLLLSLGVRAAVNGRA